jgi:hypothetical protein
MALFCYRFLYGLLKFYLSPHRTDCCKGALFPMKFFKKRYHRHNHHAGVQFHRLVGFRAKEFYYPQFIK